jgi:carbonic anhydrase
VMQQHKTLLRAFPISERADRLCELNVIEQVANVCQTTVVQDAWRRGQRLAVHGWIYGVNDGRIRELGIGVDSVDGLAAAYEAALEAVRSNGQTPPGASSLQTAPAR